MRTLNSVNRNRWFWLLALFAVTLLALALRWYYVTTAMVIDPIRSDARQYYAYAINLADHGVFSQSLPSATSIVPDSYRDPGYPLFLAAWMKVLGTTEAWYAAVLLCQALLGALTVTLAMQLGKYWLSPRLAIGAGVLIAVWPHSISINSDLLTETLFGFLCALAMLIYANAYQLENSRRAFAAGLVFGAAALTNAVLLPFGILLAGYLMWRRLAARKFCIAMALGALLLPGAWAIRNGQIPPLTNGETSTDRALQNFVQGTWPSYHPAWRTSIFGNAQQIAGARNALHAIDAEYDLLRTDPAKGIAAIMRRFEQHPLQYVSWYLLEKPRELWGWGIRIGQGGIYVYPTGNSPFRTQPEWMALAAICRASNLPLMLLMLAGLLLALPKQRPFAATERQASRVALLAVAGLLIYATLVYTALQAEPRYSIPFRSFEILLAATALSEISAKWRKHRQTILTMPPPKSLSVDHVLH